MQSGGAVTQAPSSRDAVQVPEEAAAAGTPTTARIHSIVRPLAFHESKRMHSQGMPKKLTRLGLKLLGEPAVDTAGRLVLFLGRRC